MNTDLLDEDGYPSNETLYEIETWEFSNTQEIIELFEFIKSIWRYSIWQEYKDETENIMLYKISTAGWSGNEDIIMSMNNNFKLWSLVWYSSKRGGHYKFKVPLNFGE